MSKRKNFVGSSCPLDKQELELLRLLTTGLTEGEVARQWGLSSGTIYNRICAIHAKLGAKTTLQAIAIAINNRWI